MRGMAAGHSAYNELCDDEKEAGTMPAATRNGDQCTGHDACPPAPLVECSQNVRINKLGAGRAGDHYSAHSCLSHPGHQDTIAAGSSTVFINGRPAARIGDAVSIGGMVQDGSGNVRIGG